MVFVSIAIHHNSNNSFVHPLFDIKKYVVVSTCENVALQTIDLSEYNINLSDYRPPCRTVYLYLCHPFCPKWTFSAGTFI